MYIEISIETFFPPILFVLTLGQKNEISQFPHEPLSWLPAAAATDDDGFVCGA